MGSNCISTLKKNGDGKRQMGGYRKSFTRLESKRDKNMMQDKNNYGF